MATKRFRVVIEFEAVDKSDAVHVVNMVSTHNEAQAHRFDTIKIQRVLGRRKPKPNPNQTVMPFDEVLVKTWKDFTRDYEKNTVYKNPNPLPDNPDIRLKDKP